MAQVTPRRRARAPTPVNGARVQHSYQAALAVAYHATLNGGRRTRLSRVEANFAKHCERPLVISYEGRTNGPEGTRSIFVDTEVPCRKCEGCLRARQREWTARAIAEMRISSRTWFITFTMDPHNHAVMAYRARVRARDWSALSVAEQFHRLHLEAGREITLWLKRIRKADRKRGWRPCRFRYMYVVEAHKSGLPHYHMLLHEQGEPVTKERLQHHWHLGFTTAKLATKSRAYYVSKYLAKDAENRVRASLRYGSEENGASRVALMRSGKKNKPRDQMTPKPLPISPSVE